MMLSAHDICAGRGGSYLLPLWGEKRSAWRTKSQLLGFSSFERPEPAKGRVVADPTCRVPAAPRRPGVRRPFVVPLARRIRFANQLLTPQGGKGEPPAPSRTAAPR